MIAETITLNTEKKVTLTAYVQEVDGEYGFSKRPAIMIIPGGGYAMCSDRETDAVALSYMKAGFQAFILRYTTNDKGAWPDPLNDYEQAMQMLVDKADEWHIQTEKIAVAGFSAGGHLAACAATVAEHKPAAAVLVSPAILKDICDACQPGMIYPAEAVDSNTAPCFIVSARDDRIVPVKNELAFEMALAENDVAFESHIYSYGGHGFSTAEDWIVTNSCTPRLKDWTALSIDWLGEIMGRFTRDGFTEPVAAGNMNANYAPVLSVECTIGYLRKKDEEVQEILKPAYKAIKTVADERGFNLDNLLEVLSTSPVRELLETVQMPKDKITEIDQRLRKIVNIP